MNKPRHSTTFAMKGMKRMKGYGSVTPEPSPAWSRRTARFAVNSLEFGKERQTSGLVTLLDIALGRPFLQ